MLEKETDHGLLDISKLKRPRRNSRSHGMEGPEQALTAMTRRSSRARVSKRQVSKAAPLLQRDAPQLRPCAEAAPELRTAAEYR